MRFLALKLVRIVKVETIFTPSASLGGGALIGLGAVFLMLGLERILGATGIMSGLFLLNVVPSFLGGPQ